MRNLRRVLTRHELAIREGAGSALAKLHVARRVEHARAVEALDICRAIARCHLLVVNLDVKRLLTELYLHHRLRLLAARPILRCMQ